MARPLVSIAIPTWNRRELLRTTLRSAQAQTYEPLEIVVSDNASDDDTASMVRELAREDDRIKLFVNDTNVGSLNYLSVLSRCRGEYVKFLNSDDLIQPTVVEQLASGLEDPDVGLAIARQDWMDEQGRPFPERLAPPLVTWWRGSTNLGGTRTLSGHELGDYCLRGTVNAFGLPSSHMFRRAEADVATIGMVDGRRYDILGDVAYCLQLAAGRRVAYSSESTTWIRIHGGAESSQERTNFIGALDWLDLVLAAPALGYLAHPASRALAIRKAALDLAALPVASAALDLRYRVADGLARAARAMQAICTPAVRLDIRQDHIIAEPDWTTRPPLRKLIDEWVRDAPDIPQDELVLLIEPNNFELPEALASVEGILQELGHDAARIPDIQIQTTVPVIA